MSPFAATFTPWFAPPPVVLLKLTQPIVEDHAHPERLSEAPAFVACGSKRNTSSKRTGIRRMGV